MKALTEKQIEQCIDQSKDHAAGVLKSIESEFRKTIEGHIVHYKYLKEEAEKRGDNVAAYQYGVRIEVYQQILNNYSLSNSYATL